MMLVHLLALLIVGYINGAPANEATDTGIVPLDLDVEKNDDLKTAASTFYSDRTADGGRYYPNSYNSGYGVTGYGYLDDRYNGYNGAGGYDNAYSYGDDRGYPRERSYGNSDGGYRNRYDSGSRYDNGGYGYGGNGYNYGADAGYGYGGNSGYSYGSNGGYGGYGGNGGLSSYYGYNNLNYPGGYHLGYGYYSKRPGDGTIYNSGITPSLVTGYRGYSKK